MKLEVFKAINIWGPNEVWGVISIDEPQPESAQRFIALFPGPNSYNRALDYFTIWGEAARNDGRLARAFKRDAGHPQRPRSRKTEPS